DYLNFFKQQLARPKSDYAPFCSILAPCRGLDEDLEKNLDALFRQDFPRYEIIFVVDSENDSALPIIEQTIHRRDAETQRKFLEKSFESSCLYGEISSKIIVAGKAKDAGQKVHNLREAVLNVSDESKIFVFVDSDARPSANWLKDLIAPLADENVGCATGYRWFISKKFSLASEMRSVWNASIASALGANLRSNFCWGGSTAVRRATWEKLGLRERLQGTLSDDFTITRALREAGLPICFVPQALTASVENCGWRELFEFTARQMKITRVYAAHLWRQAFLGSFLFNLVFVWGILNLIFNSINSLSFWFSLAALILISAFSVGKSYFRLKAVRLVLKNYERELKKQFWMQNTLWIFAPAVYLYNCLSAFFSNEICWRGIKYKLKSPRETIVMADKTPVI
ncbi:MAG: glycosyltransferase, partial [Pyrinomonadaceae bacterium]